MNLWILIPAPKNYGLKHTDGMCDTELELYRRINTMDLRIMDLEHQHELINYLDKHNIMETKKSDGKK